MMRRSSTKTRICQTTRTTERGEKYLRAAVALLVKSRMRLCASRLRKTLKDPSLAEGPKFSEAQIPQQVSGDNPTGAH